MAKEKKSKDEVSAERQQQAEEARKHLVQQYLHLGSAMKRTSAAVEAYAIALNEAGTSAEVLALLRAPTSMQMPGMPESFPFLVPRSSAAPTAPVSSSTTKKRASEDSDDELADDAAEVNGKKGKRAKKEKAAKDPNAPKRPMSAYLIFQNSVREELKNKHPELPYKELINIVGEHWKELGDEGQKPYKDAATEAMSKWKKASADYLVAKGEAADATSLLLDQDDEDAEVEDAVLPKKKEKKEKPIKDKSLDKRTKEGKAAAAAAAAAAGQSTPVPAGKPVSSSKKDIKPLATSTPAAKPSSKPAAPASTKKNVPQTAAESSSSAESSTSDEESSDSESE